MLIEVGRPGEALTEYEVALMRAPARLAGLYGAARAAALAGDGAKAQAHYSQIALLTTDGDGDRPEVQEACDFVGKLPAR